MIQLIAIVLCLSTHDGPPVRLQIDVLPDGLAIVLQGERSALHPWLDLSPELVAVGAEAVEAITGAVHAAFETRQELWADGIRVEPRVEAVGPAGELEFGGEPGTRIELSVALAQAPQRLRLLWRATFDEQWNDEPMPVTIKVRGRFDWRTVSEAEPECVWHARGRERQRPALSISAPLDREAPTLSLPMASMACALAGLLMALVPRWGRGPRLAGLGLSMVAALCLRSVGVVEIERPFEEVERPTRAEALALFESLHRNVYSAFSADTEDELYERLADSFDGKILDRQYQDVFKSLEMRERGGAMSQVEEIEVLDRDVDFERERPEVEPIEGEGPSFWVSWTWRVHCQVVHWGHRHRRMNHYEADYWVRHDGRQWRIAFVNVWNHERVHDDEEGWAEMVGVRDE